MKRYEVTGHRLLIKPDLPKEKTEWGFQMVGETFEREKGAVQEGILVQIGPNAWLDFKSKNAQGELVAGTPWASVGDRVKFAKYAGKEIRGTDGEIEYIIINDEDLQCIVHEEVEIEEDSKDG